MAIYQLMQLQMVAMESLKVKIRLWICSSKRVKMLRICTLRYARDDKMGIMPYDDKAGNAKLIKLQPTQKD